MEEIAFKDRVRIVTSLFTTISVQSALGFVTFYNILLYSSGRCGSRGGWYFLSLILSLLQLKQSFIFLLRSTTSIVATLFLPNLCR
ncbi:hypothetical protein, partial [Cysteiniphilum litorale]|uniref:hypothetical protein n=1 Tax=Cysteiniphilum litorale TaxID=2056700 RepID=UPI003F881622